MVRKASGEAKGAALFCCGREEVLEILEKILGNAGRFGKKIGKTAIEKKAVLQGLRLLVYNESDAGTDRQFSELSLRRVFL